MTASANKLKIEQEINKYAHALIKQNRFKAAELLRKNGERLTGENLEDDLEKLYMYYSNLIQTP
ncbi:MAG: hypothetical protein IJA34_00260 [Lachnospiraceae bacterium]|nr:hypothetical protein [Lachnospiraceae bacterium]